MKRFLIVLPLLIMSLVLSAQEENKTSDSETTSTYTRIEKNTFKSVMLINAPTVRLPRKNQLVFVLSHRFGYLSSGFPDLYGLDNATTRFGFEYGLSKKMALGIGRSNYKRNYDFYGKYALLQQSKGAKNVPLTIDLIQSVNISSARWPDNGNKYLFAHRMSYSSQLLIARKFNDHLSLQLMPTFVHRNLVPTAADRNDLISIGFGGRYRISNWMALTGEYYHALPGQLSDQYTNPLSIGVDLETSGHVFQLFFTNASSVYPAGFIGETTDQWKNGKIRFGFNLTRTF